MAKRKRHDAAPIAQWSKGSEAAFRAAFDNLFEPAKQRLDGVLDGQLTSAEYYGLVAILHDMALAHAKTLTGTRKPGRETAK